MRINIYLNYSTRREVINAELEVNKATNEIGYHYPNTRSERLYWSLPKEYTGNKLTSYGSNLTLTQHIITRLGARTYADQDVIIFGNDVTLYWKNPQELTPGVKVVRLTITISYSV